MLNAISLHLRNARNGQKSITRHLIANAREWFARQSRVKLLPDYDLWEVWIFLQGQSVITDEIHVIEMDYWMCWCDNLNWATLQFLKVSKSNRQYDWRSKLCFERDNSESWLKMCEFRWVHEVFSIGEYSVDVNPMFIYL